MYYEKLVRPLLNRRFCVVCLPEHSQIVLQRPTVFRTTKLGIGTISYSKPVMSIRIYTGLYMSGSYESHSLIGLYSHVHKMYIGTFARIPLSSKTYHFDVYNAELYLTEALRRGSYNWLMVAGLRHCNHPLLLRISRRSLRKSDGRFLPKSKWIMKGGYYLSCFHSPECNHFLTPQEAVKSFDPKGYYVMPPTRPSVFIETVPRPVAVEVNKYYILFCGQPNPHVPTVVKVVDAGPKTADVKAIIASAEGAKTKAETFEVDIERLYPIDHNVLNLLYPDKAQVQAKASAEYRNLPQLVKNRVPLVFEKDGVTVDWVATMQAHYMHKETDEEDSEADETIIDVEKLELEESAEVAVSSDPKHVPELKAGDEDEVVLEGDEEEGEEESKPKLTFRPKVKTQ